MNEVKKNYHNIVGSTFVTLLTHTKFTNAQAMVVGWTRVICYLSIPFQPSLAHSDSCLERKKTMKNV